MPRKIEGAEADGEQIRLPAGLALKPPISAADLREDTEYDPEGAEEFVALIRALRQEALRPAVL